MKPNRNSRVGIFLSYKLFALGLMLCAVPFFLLILYPDKASSGPYLDSAHGNYNPGYGVLRTPLSTPPNDYGRGNCAHCHEQHASIGGAEPNPTGGPDKYALFSNSFNTSKTIKPYLQSDSICFYCHIVTGTLQNPIFYNYSYSYTFGGCSITDCPTANIFDAVNSLSYHNLYDMFRFVTGLSGTHSNFTNFPADSNPCSGCHNIHIAQRSCGKPSGSFDTTKSAISKPTDHSNLWGDSAGEKMSNYTASYQAPYNSSTPTYEPDGSAISDPSKLPDYVTFCTDCHNATNTIYSTTLSRNLYTINWANEMHGRGDANDDYPATSELRLPYQDTNRYVLSCTDCHEPHGSPNIFLIRKEVNNGTVTVQTGTGSSGKEWLFFCDNCHDNLDGGAHIHATGAGCVTCHPGGNYKVCTDCHYHGTLF